ncbi:MAG: hypothetical protein D6706_03015 [Chloroflexi bacterium]|nr:MAG: hypothetical protein D6706_03015 [Chloroflexota bacterium]
MGTTIHSTHVQQPAINEPLPEVHLLRQRLRDLNAWPEAGDELLALLSVSRWSASEVSTGDLEWLPQVVKDALAGKDIGAQYPAFFQKLLTNGRLRQLFLENLDHFQKMA